jgi:hypothetical protein
MRVVAGGRRYHQRLATALAAAREQCRFQGVALVQWPVRAFVTDDEVRRRAERVLAVRCDGAKDAAAVAAVLNFQAWCAAEG